MHAKMLRFSTAGQMRVGWICSNSQLRTTFAGVLYKPEELDNNEDISICMRNSKDGFSKVD